MNLVKEGKDIFSYSKLQFGDAYQQLRCQNEYIACWDCELKWKQ